MRGRECGKKLFWRLPNGKDFLKRVFTNKGGTAEDLRSNVFRPCFTGIKGVFLIPFREIKGIKMNSEFKLSKKLFYAKN